MSIIMKSGIAITLAGLLLFFGSFFGSSFQLTSEILQQTISDSAHLQQIQPEATAMLNKNYSSGFTFANDFKKIVADINTKNRTAQQWDKVIYSDYTFAITKNSTSGYIKEHNKLLLLLIVICIFFGALLYIIPKYGLGLKGIKNNHIYFDKLNARGWVGILIGTLLILFYIVLYWFPYYLSLIHI